MKKFSLQNLGPGLLYAGAAVGVSHLVQSTRAGASYGLWMVAIVLVTNLVKYPFFEFTSRYTAVKRKSVLEAYKDMGNWALWLFLAITVLTMFIIQAAIVTVTSGLAKGIFGLDLSMSIISAFILVITATTLIIGKYSLLDKLMKFIIISLTATSLVAAFLSVGENLHRTNQFNFNMDLSENAHLFFLVALIGWMPAPIDITVWQSMWTRERQKSDNNFDLKSTLFDFKIGYWGTAILAVLFVILGSMTLYNTNIELASGGVAFSNQLLGIYTTSIGSWAYPIIAVAALTTMFSTNLSVMDAYPRVLGETIRLLGLSTKKIPYSTWIALVVSGTLIVVFFFMKNMRQMVDLATTLSFLSAPILGFLNYKIVTNKNFPDNAKPNKLLRTLSIIGLTVMVVLSVVYIYTKIV
ncbi:MAG: divalent metal cation transporter [Ichthyobacteriaceae bacterium]|nr:divalent metal cation transporter [Ichthyobacteriaceae bacterium]